MRDGKLMPKVPKDLCRYMRSSFSYRENLGTRAESYLLAWRRLRSYTKQSNKLQEIRQLRVVFSLLCCLSAYIYWACSTTESIFVSGIQAEASLG